MALQYSHSHLAEIVTEELRAESEANAAVTGIRPELSVEGGIPRQRGVLFSDPGLVANLKASVCRPDLTRLGNFTASSHIFDRNAVRTRYGLATPVPDPILNVLSVLPPAHLYTGPFIHPHLVVDMLQQIADSLLAKPEPAAAAATAARAAAPQPTQRRGGPEGARKRKTRDATEEEEDEEGESAQVNPNDIFRQRQKLKQAKPNEP